MRTRLCLVTLAAALFASCPAEAQPTKGTYRIGILHPATPPEAGTPAYVRLLRTRGYVEGQNLVVERRYAAGRAERLPDLAKDPVRLKVGLIVAT